MPTPTTETSTSDENNIQQKETLTSISTLPVNIERINENAPKESTDTPYEPSHTYSTTEHSVNTLNNVNNLENRVADEINNTQDPTKTPVTTENNVELKIPSQKTINTENSNTECDKEAVSENNNSSQVPDRSTPEKNPININTENTTQVHATPTSSTLKNSNQTNPKEDWSSLMFSSDNSLFKEMIKQLEDDTNKNGVKRKSSMSTIASTSTSTEDQDTLPDIVYSGKRSDALTGLLMLGVDPEQLDAEIDNKLMMLVNKPKQPDISKPTIEKDNKKNNKCKNKQGSQETLCRAEISHTSHFR